MKKTIVAISLLVALTAWIFIWPVKTAAEPKQKVEPTPTINYLSKESADDSLPVPKEEPKPNNRILAKPETSPFYSGRHYSREEVQQLIRDYSALYGIPDSVPLRIARCESGFQWDAANPISSARGPFQYLSSTWANTPEGKAGVSVYDADANVRTAVRHIAVHGTSPWNPSKHCWS